MMAVRRPTLGVFATTMVIVATADVVRADPVDDLTRAAGELAAKGDFLGAAAKFREAYAAAPRPELMCNVGVAFYKGKDYPHAQRYLEQCVTAGGSLDAKFIDAVRQVMSAVDAKLRAGDFTPIDLAVEPASALTTVRYGGRADEPIVGARRAWVPFGDYALAIHAEGYSDRVVEGTAHGHDAIAIRAKLDPVATPPVDHPPPVDHDHPPPVDRDRPPPIDHDRPPPPRPQTREVHGARGPAIALTAVTGVLGLGALGSYAFAVHRASQANGAMDRPSYDADVASARRWQHASWLAGGLAGASAIASGYLWWRASRTTVVEITPGGVAVAGRF